MCKHITVRVAVALTVAVPSLSPLAAQQPRCERGVPAVDLGVSFAAPANEEPRVEAVDPKGPAVNRLQKGDYISRVNGYPMASPQATTIMREGEPGRAMVLTVRRASKLVPVTITPARVHCSTLAALQPARVPLTQGAGSPSRVLLAPAMGATTVAGHMSPTSAGWLGMGFACSECEQRATSDGRVWYFQEYPTIYNVDPGGPAYSAGIRRGDVLLRVDGQDVRTAGAGSRLGQVDPGESLRLTYRRGNRTSDVMLRAARSPSATRTLDRVAAESLIRSTEDLRVTEMEAELRRMNIELEKNMTAQRTLTRQLESALARNPSNSSAARATLNRLQRLQDESLRAQQRSYEAALRAGEEDARRLGLVQQRLYEVTQIGEPAASRVTGTRLPTVVPARTDRLRFSGSVGDSDVEVRGPGSVDVQRLGDDLVIVTPDAVVTITQRKQREGNSPR